MKSVLFRVRPWLTRSLMGGRGRGGAGGNRQREFEPPKPLKGWGTVAIGPVR
jgi:hypothetical protein